MTTHAAPFAPLSPSEHQREVEAWRAGRLARLRADDGWLVIAGLFFLVEGDNGFGSAEDNRVVLAAHSAPAHGGRFVLAGEQVSIVPAAETSLLVGGQPVPADGRVLRVEHAADAVTLGDLRMVVIERETSEGVRKAVRVRDLRSTRRAEFRGFDYFPLRADHRVTARFIPHPAGTTIPITSVLGKVSATRSPGKVTFELGGKQLSLDAVQDDPKDTRMSVLFRDLTAGHESYGAGRFLYTEGLPGPDGRVVLDFNKAYNPPCALSPFVTCPLPPPQNRLDVRVEAGEMKPADLDH
jgi:uncharacterized protein (DUF1684 family)